VRHDASNRERLARRAGGLALASAALAAACAEPSSAPLAPAPAVAPALAPDPGRVLTVVHGALGCLFELSIHDVAEADARRVAARATAEIDRVEDLLGGWRDDTALALLNREAAARSIAAPPLLYDSVVRALELTRATEGAFDVTVGPLVDAYGFRLGTPRLPPPDELERLAGSVGSEHVLVDPAGRTLAFDRPGVVVDLDGFNKGVAVDRVIELLRAAGVADASISAGGSTIGSIGPPPSRPPRTVAVAGPDGEVHARVPLRDAVLSTSGNWRRAIEMEGREVGPIFDPRSGEPVSSAVLSATAIAVRGDDSEAFAKAAIVLGVDGAQRLVEAHGGLGLVLLVRSADPDAEIEVLRLGSAVEGAR